ncbi:MAG: hypothetical protein FJ399_02040 [Verrucomicrobia bacterium]|nr:hypothetical protein [Verrucomicrobiota bacterium]
MIRLLIALIGLHSLALGILMLAVPRFMLGLLGFAGDIPLFFPSQSGIFLLVLGICYLLALRERGFVKVILISKAGAVLFLVTHAALLHAPPIIWAAAAGDAAMLTALAIALRLEHHAAAVSAAARAT